MPAELLLADRFGWRRRIMRDSEIAATGDPAAEAAVLSVLDTDGLDSGAHDTNAIDPDALAHAVEKVEGHFAVIARHGDLCCAIVDHCRSTPVFYTNSSVSNDAHLLRSHQKLDALDSDGVTDAAMAGFVTGRRTLVAGLHQLEAGGLAIWRGTSEPEVVRYRTYMPSQFNTRSEDELVENVLNVLDGAITRTIEAAAGRPLWVPLSGGRDSRVLLAKFVEHGYDNLFAFTYGPRGNDEKRAAKTIAERLNVSWKFVASKPATMRRFFASPERSAYWQYCDGLAAVPNFQDLLTLRQFNSSGALPRDAIIVNGQTGDFISGGHIPAALMSGDSGTGALFDAITGKHFSLWKSLKTPDRLAALRGRVFGQLGIHDGEPLDRDRALALYERFEFDERQAKYVINGQRNYEFLERDWALPLWDRAFVEFWRNVPVEQKYRQKLFRNALDRWNYRGLFRDFNPQVDQWSGVAKAVLVPSRLIRLTQGPAKRDAFLRYMLYFGMYQDQYAPFGYREFSRQARDLRNPVSLLSRAWLAERDVNAGVP